MSAETKPLTMSSILDDLRQSSMTNVSEEIMNKQRRNVFGRWLRRYRELYGSIPADSVRSMALTFCPELRRPKSGAREHPFPEHCVVTNNDAVEQTRPFT